MEITDFFNKDFLSSFAGTLVSVELIVFVTKEIPVIKKMPTRLYTFLCALIHFSIFKINIEESKISIQGIYGLFINALVITVVLCGGYDAIIDKINYINNGRKSDNSL